MNEYHYMYMKSFVRRSDCTYIIFQSSAKLHIDPAMTTNNFKQKVPIISREKKTHFFKVNFFFDRELNMLGSPTKK